MCERKSDVNENFYSVLTLILTRKMVPFTLRLSSCPALALSILLSSSVNLSFSVSCRCFAKSIFQRKNQVCV